MEQTGGLMNRLFNQKTIIPLCFLAAVLLAAATVIYAGLSFRLDNIRLEPKGVIEYDSGWTLPDGREVTLPCTVSDAGGHVVVSNQLPDVLERGTVLFLRTDHQQIRVAVDGETIYEFGMANESRFGKLFGVARNVVPLPEDAAGKTISVSVSSPYRMRGVHLYNTLLGSEGSVILRLLSQRLGVLIFTGLMLLIGLLLIVVSAVFKFGRFHINHRSFFYLGVFAVMSALWTFTDSELTQFVVSNQAVGYLTSFFNFMLLPVPFVLYIRENCSNGGKYLGVMALLFVAGFAVSLLLYVTGALELAYSVMAVHALILAALVMILHYCVIEWVRYRSKPARNMLVALAILALSVVVSLASFYLGSRLDLSRYFRDGLLCFILVLSFGSFRRSVSLLNARAEAKMYKRLAFCDTMTMLKNRAAFDVEMQRIEKEETGAVTLVLFDLNNLKMINDTFGHISGDAVIVGFSKAMAEVFRKTGGGYRIGGDEFAAILRFQDDQRVAALLAELQGRVEQYNKSHTGTIDFAWGTASAVGGTDRVGGLFNEADAAMYRQKTKTGHGRNRT